MALVLFSDAGEPVEAFPAFDTSSSSPTSLNPPTVTRRGRARTSTLVGASEAIPNLGDCSASSAGGSTPIALPPTKPAQPSIDSAQPRRSRRRTATIVGETNPLECPVTPAEQQLANLVRSINHCERRRTSTAPLLPAFAEVTALQEATPVETTATVKASHLETSALEARDPEVSSNLSIESEQTQINSASSSGDTDATNAEAATYRGFVNSDLSDLHHYPPWKYLTQNRPSPRLALTPTFKTQVRRVEITPPVPEVLHFLEAATRNMSYQNYLDSPGGGPGPNARQAPPSPSQGMHQNGGGMNGGMGLAGGMVGFPTPAGHQSDLNYIMQMVEELSGQLAQNQGLTAGIVDKMGKVRAKAKGQELSNDELLAIAASELNVSSENLERENSELRKALEKTLHDKKENWKIAIHGANILSDILEKMHKFKATHEADTLAWHKNYRGQLSAEREENLNLRNQINDMKAASCRANDYLRQMRRYLTDHDEMNELRIQNIKLRQERRLWKRMALPLIPQDDDEWSDDDDIIDPEEKKRLASEKAEKERKDKEGEEGGDAPGAVA